MVTAAFPVADLAVAEDVTMSKQKAAGAPKNREGVVSNVVYC